MKMKRFKVGILFLLALIIALPLGTMGCKRNMAPAGTEIKIGVMGGVTGVGAASIGPLMEELEKIFEYMNEVEGGINGATIEWQIEDNNSTPAGAVAAYRTLHDTYDPLLYIAIEDYYLAGEKAAITEDESVILTTSAIDPSVYTLPSRFFAVTIPTSDGFGGFVKWAQDDFDGTGNAKIGVLYWDDRASGPQWQMALGWAATQDVDIVSRGYSIVTQDLTAQMLALQEADVDYIWVHGLTSNAAVAVDTFNDLELADDGIKLCFMEYIEPDTLLELVEEDADGFYFYRSETPYADNSVAAQHYTDIYEHAGVENEESDFRHLITLKYVITAAIEQAVADVGWENLDNVAIYEALLKLTDIDTYGNTGSFGFGATKRLGVHTIKMAQFTTDGTVSVSDEIELPSTFSPPAE
ncbi:ABC transporter substrate-binding protein [Chloroflexota bacterium]